MEKRGSESSNSSVGRVKNKETITKLVNDKERHLGIGNAYMLGWNLYDRATIGDDLSQL